MKKEKWDSSENSSFIVHRSSFSCRFLSVSVCVFCLWGMTATLRAAYTRTVLRYFPELSRLEAARKTTPNDPILLGSLGIAYFYDPNRLDRDEATTAARRAVELSPNDARLLLLLGRVAEQAEHGDEAETSLREGVRLAPNHFEPVFALASFLLRDGRLDDSIPVFRRAMEINPSQIPVILDLMDQVLSGDKSAVGRVLPDSEAARGEWFQFLIRKRLFDEAAAAWIAMSPKDRDRLGGSADFLVERLLEEKRFAVAWEIWSARNRLEDGLAAKGDLQNPAFVRAISEADGGFWWRYRAYAQAETSREAGPESGGFVLKFSYHAPSPVNFDHLRQIVPTSPSTKYRLRFSMRGSSLVSGALPTVEVGDPARRDASSLGRFAVPSGTYDWKSGEIEFETSSDAEAIEIAVKREATCGAPCPIFGDLRLGKFRLERIPPTSKP